MVSDGSKLACKMTFGWILCTSNELRLAICSGPAYGTGTSHRAEATGMLSAAKFLYHLAQHCNTPIVNQLIYTSDNKGLIIRMRQRQQYKICFPNVTLAPDWDLTKAIHDSTQHLKEPPKYRHVLGHQDTTTHYSQLPLTAQLNVDADEAAGAFHWSHATTILATVALFPTTKAHLRIGNTTITGHYKHQIRRAASTADFFQKCRHIHHWDDATFNNIQLSNFRTAARNSNHRHKFIFKYIRRGPD
jgi:hypothetical protein